MRPEITLTDAEREKLEAAWQTWDATGYHRDSPWGAVVADLVRLALAAVPRLALAAPVVGELVALVRDYDRVYWEVAQDNESREALYPALTRDVLQERLAALTGEEGRDAE